MRHAAALVLAVAMATIGLGAAAHAAVPLRFTVQGILRDDTGKLQSIPVDVTVRLYDASVGGTLVAGPYGPIAAMAVNGLFTTAFQDPALAIKLAAATELWLEVSAGSDTFARQLVTSQLYAIMAAHADTADSAKQADALGPACSGCVQTTHLGPEVVRKENIKAGDLTHNHRPVLTRTTATTQNIGINAMAVVCSPACAAPAVIMNGSCTQTGRARIVEVDANTTTQKYCCAFQNDSGAVVAVAVSGVCLSVEDTSLP